MAHRLTDRFIRSLPSPASGNRISYDATVRGFGVRATARGAKAFVLNYRASGRERRITIGAFPDWSLSAAREQAKLLKRQIDLGYDPMARRHEARASPTVAQLASRYLEEYAVRKTSRSRKDGESMLR